MKIWQLAAPKNLQRAESPDLKISEGTAKVKITKALLSEVDVAAYAGLHRVSTPLILGRFAIGQVTEADEQSFMKKGDRVYFASTTEDELSPDGLKVAGETMDGFYRDFAVVNAEDVCLGAHITPRLGDILRCLCHHVKIDLSLDIIKTVLGVKAHYFHFTYASIYKIVFLSLSFSITSSLIDGRFFFTIKSPLFYILSYI